jgi:hypothetical protein
MVLPPTRTRKWKEPLSSGPSSKHTRGGRSCARSRLHRCLWSSIAPTNCHITPPTYTPTAFALPPQCGLSFEGCVRSHLLTAICDTTHRWTSSLFVSLCHVWCGVGGSVQHGSTCLLLLENTETELNSIIYCTGLLGAGEVMYLQKDKSRLLFVFCSWRDVIGHLMELMSSEVWYGWWHSRVGRGFL